MNQINAFILEQAKLLYRVEFVKENTMGNSGNKVFEVKTQKDRYMLKASDYTSESKSHTSFQLKWMEYLASHLSAVIKPIRSVKNNLCEVIHFQNKSYILCLFEKAPGKIVDISNPEEFNEDLFFRLGALMGNMHKLTIDYKGNIRKPEFEWTGAVTSWRYNNKILDSDVQRSLHYYFGEIKKLPIKKDNYGIIHYDIHTDNFFVHNSNIKLFDFDACQFNWFAADMASAIFFMVQKGAGPLTNKSEKERIEFAETYFISYLKGYLESNTISAYWIKKIELFMKYQMGDEYIYAQNYWPQELADQRDWYKNWFGDKIKNNLPYVFIDYEKIIKSLPFIDSL